MEKEGVRFGFPSGGKKIAIVWDSTKIRLVDGGEYRTKKYGKTKSWIKMHLSVGMNSMALTEVTTTDYIGDPTAFGRLVKPIEKNISQLDADGAYDNNRNFEWSKNNNIVCAILSA